VTDPINAQFLIIYYRITKLKKIEDQSLKLGKTK